MNKKLIFAMVVSLLLTVTTHPIGAQAPPQLTTAPTNDSAKNDVVVNENPRSDSKIAGPLSRSSIQLETTSVTGSRELPKVMVIVPWKTSESMGPGERPLASLVEDALTPLDPDVFRRELNYYSALKTAKDEAKASPQVVAPDLSLPAKPTAKLDISTK